MYNHKSDHVWLKIFCSSVLLLEKKNSLAWHIRFFMIWLPCLLLQSRILLPGEPIYRTWRCSVISWLHCFCLNCSLFPEGLSPHKSFSTASLKHRQSSTLGSFLRLNKLGALYNLTTLNLLFDIQHCSLTQETFSFEDKSSFYSTIFNQQAKYQAPDVK